MTSPLGKSLEPTRHPSPFLQEKNFTANTIKYTPIYASYGQLCALKTSKPRE